MTSVVRFDFRDYQAATVEHVAGKMARRHFLIEYPTGSGKTSMAVVILAMTVGRDFTHGLVVAPQVQIEDGFISDGPVDVIWPAVSSRPPLCIPAGFVSRARDVEEPSIARAILDYLADPFPGRVLAATHGALVYLVRNLADQIPADLAGCLLTVDEAHHVGPNRLGEAVDFLEGRGARLLYLTATAYSGDSRVVERPGMEIVRRSTPEHIEGGRFSPSRVGHRVAPFAYGDATESEFLGNSATRDAGAVVALSRAMVNLWLADGRPKLIVRTPPLRGGSAPLVRAIVGAFEDVGARVRDGTGVGAGRQAMFLAALKDERLRMRQGDPSGEDVVVGCRRVEEGTDWPWCSSVYTVGVPGSLRDVVQLVGRAMRKKPDSYPERHRDLASITFFVPTPDGSFVGELSRECARHALMMFVAMADYGVAESWIVTRAVRSGLGEDDIDGRLGGDEGAPVTPSDLVTVEHGLDTETYMLVRAAMAAAAEGADSITARMLIDAAREVCPDAPEAGLEVVAAGIIAADPKVGGNVAAAITREIGRLSKVRPDVREAIREALAVVVEEFRDEELGQVESLRLIAEQAVELGGIGIKSWLGRSVAGFTFHGWTLEKVRSEAEEFRVVESRYPSSNDRPKWSSAALFIKKETGLSLGQFLDSENAKGCWYWTLEKVRLEGEEFKVVEGRYPSGCDGSKWESANRLTKKEVGLTLGQFLDHENAKVFWCWTLEKVKSDGEEFKVVEGKYPSFHDGLKWQSASKFTKKKTGLSLGQFLDSENHRENYKTYDWTLEKVRLEGEAFKVVEGRYPSHHDGLKWQSAERLTKKETGLSLSRFLDPENAYVRWCWTLEKVKSEGEEFKVVEGRYPLPSDGKRWASAYHFTRKETGLNLGQFLDPKNTPKSRQVYGWTLDSVRSEAEVFKATEGKYPSSKDGSKWDSANHFTKKEVGLSLNKFLRQPPPTDSDHPRRAKGTSSVASPSDHPLMGGQGGDH